MKTAIDVRQAPHAAVFWGLAIAGVVAVLYIPALSFSLWGDDFQWLALAYPLRHNPLVLFEKTISFFRPIVRLSFFLNYALFRHNVVAYNIITIGVHVLNTVLLYIFLLRLTKKILFAGLTAFLFGTSSFYSEVPIWASERTDSYLAACTLGIFVLFSKAEPLRGVKNWLIYLCLFLGALGSKESWMVLPGLLFIFLLLSKQYSVKRAMFETAPAWVLLSIYVGIFFLHPIIRGTDTAFSYSDPLNLETLKQAGVKICYLMYKYVGFGDYFYGDAWQIALVIIGGIAIMGAALGFKNRLIFWGLVWMLGTLVPTMHIYYAPSRFNYLPLMGFWVMLVALCESLAVAIREKFAIRHRFIAGLFALCVTYVFLYHAVMVQWEIHDYRVYTDLHVTVIDRFLAVQKSIPLDRPVILIDNGTQNATLTFDRAIRGHIKMQYSRPGGLWQILYFDQLFNYAGDPFTHLMEMVYDPDFEAVLQRPFTVVMFDDEGFEISPRAADWLREFYVQHHQLPENVQVYTIRSAKNFSG